MCSIAEYLRVVLYFDEPAGRVKIQTSKNTQRYYTSKRLISDLLSNCFHWLAFLIVSVVKTLKIFKKILVQHARTHVNTRTSQNFFSSLQSLCRKLLTKNGRNLSRLWTYNSLKYWETIKTIELNRQLHNYSNRFVFNFRTLTWQTRLHPISERRFENYLLQTNKHLHTKNCFNLLTCRFLSFSILFRWILCRLTVAGAVTVRQKLKYFDDSLHARGTQHSVAMSLLGQ